MKYFVSLFLSLFFLVFMSCGNEDNAWDNNIPIITPNEQSDSSGLLKSQITDIINYSKINFDENFNNTELYKNLILSPKWENVSMVLQKQDTLHLCVPLLAQDNPEHNSYYLFISGEFYQFNLSSCIRQQNSLTAQFVSFSLANLANIFFPPPIFTIINLCLL